MSFCLENTILKDNTLIHQNQEAILKHIYIAVGLFLLFLGSIFFFGQSIPELTVEETSATSIQDSTFPLVYIQVDDHVINTLHGYSSKLDSGLVRESITPLSAKKTFQIKVRSNESKIKKITYDLKDIANDKSLENNSLTAFDYEKEYLTTSIRLDTGLDTSTEYGLELVLTTSYSKKIHFYTRVKYYADNCFLNEKLAFVNKFHKACYDSKTDFDFNTYLEANTNKDTSFGYVDIHSSKSMITWKKISPKIITEVVPTINEINIETAAISQNYFVQMDTDSGTETFLVKEYYRLRYSGGRIYLLGFQRTMEALFDPALISITKSEFKIGITNQTDMEIASSNSNKKIAFVRNGNLWYYNLENNKLTCIFSFSHKTGDFYRDQYDQHDIQILKIDDDGNISFTLYGYMNCGDYEGRVGILLYDYDAKKNNIKERVYIPLSTTYQQLKEDMGEFSYVNDKDIFYFSIYDKVYAYNISSKKYDILTEHATRDHFSMLSDAKCFVWSNQGKNSQPESITILNLDTNKTIIVNAPKNQSIQVMGTIDSNIVYGFVKNKDIYESSGGTIIKPCYQLHIADCEGTIVRTYEIPNRYVIGAVVDDNVITLHRVKKSNGSFHKTTDDTIMNQKNTETKSVKMTTRITNDFLTEKYLALPAGYIMEQMPEVSSTKCLVVTENTTLHLSEKEMSTLRFYIYAYGGITNSTTSASKAIILADEQMGVVMDNESHIIWERGGKFLSKSISSVSYPDDTPTNAKACAKMILEAAQVTVSGDELKEKSIMSMLRKHLEHPVNLSGCTLDEVLYFVSSEKPVIGMLSANHGVLITGYTTSQVTWMDPSTRTSKTVSLATGERMFKEAGYQFYSYISY